MSDVNFDKRYWPECGATIGQRPSEPYDLRDLWQDHEEQAAVFVAEALVYDPPRISFQLSSEANIKVFLWSVGGDCLTVEEPLAELIDASYRVYDHIRSDEQAEDVKERLTQLELVAAAIARARGFLEGQLKQYEPPSPQAKTHPTPREE